MKKLCITWGLLGFFLVNMAQAQDKQTIPSIFKIPTRILAGEGLKEIPQDDSSRTVYQKRVYNGVDIAIYMVAIGTGITNEFQGFPMEEFIFWINGKAIVEPEGEAAFPIYTGDYFIQAKGFRGKWNFVDIGGVHLELALVAKNRPDSSFKSPMSKALLLDRDILSGVKKPEKGRIYQGPELTLNILDAEQALSRNRSRERMLHLLNGVLGVELADGSEMQFYPGDFIVVSPEFKGTFQSNSLQQLRILEVYKTKN